MVFHLARRDLWAAAALSALCLAATVATAAESGAIFEAVSGPRGGVNLCATTALSAPPPAPLAVKGELDIAYWLVRVNEASRRRNYIGTFVVWSSDGSMASSRIWHACEGDVQMERVDSLSGSPRTTLRRNDQVLTFMPESKLARAERRESLDLFPNVLQSSVSTVADFYVARYAGAERVAGFDADVVVLQPKDALRYGYRIWAEKRTQLVIKLQTLDTDNRVLEQSAFSELELDAPVRTDKLAQMMDNTSGYKVERFEQQKVSVSQEGWTLKVPVTGFQLTSCVKRPNAGNSLGSSIGPAGAASPGNVVAPSASPSTAVLSGSAPPGGVQPATTLQCIFSDGLATVSLFVEPFDAQRHSQEAELAMGATQTLTQRIARDWWLTAVGEVPPRTLKSFAQNLVRRK